MSNQWNPFYVCYAKAHGRTPKDQLSYDERRMHRFIIWMGVQYHAWSKETGETRAWGGAWSDEQIKRFGKWLARQ